MKQTPITKILKYFIIFSLIFVGVYFLVNEVFIPWKKDRDQKAQINKWQEEMERPYREDTVGGNTPEETLNIFIQALKDGDLDYASKFFVLEKQKEWLENLKKIKEAGYLDEMVGDLLRVEPDGSPYEGRFQYSLVDKENVVIMTIDLNKNINEKWKITRL